MPVNKLLIISNGHGDDAIAAEIARRLPKGMEVNAYPMLGSGRAYEGVCPIVGPRLVGPTESHRPLTSFLREALSVLRSRPALDFLRGEAKNYDAILVVGDMIGVLASWLSFRKVRIYVDVSKSGYTHAYSWGEMVVLRRTAKLVLTRDEVLARQLVAEKVNARFSGSVMMDTLETGFYDPRWYRRNVHAIAVLPGSGAALVDNFAVQLDALRRVPGIEGIDVFAVLASPDDAARLVRSSRMRLTPPPQRLGDWGTVSDGRVTIHLSTRSLGAVLAASDIVLGQGGTADLQALGLGRPVLGFQAKGEALKVQKQDMAIGGEARIFTPRDPNALAAAIAKLLADPAERARRGATGRERIGPPGVVAAIVEELSK